MIYHHFQSFKKMKSCSVAYKIAVRWYHIGYSIPPVHFTSLHYPNVPLIGEPYFWCVQKYGYLAIVIVIVPLVSFFQCLEIFQWTQIFYDLLPSFFFTDMKHKVLLQNLKLKPDFFFFLRITSFPLCSENCCSWCRQC